MFFLRHLFHSPARDLDRRVRAFRAEVLAARASGDAARLTALCDRPAALGLTEDDVALELEMVDGLLDVIALQEASAQGAMLDVVETSHRALTGEVCRFMAPAGRPDHANDSGGKLFFTDRRLAYLGASSLAISWAHVAGVRDVERDLVIRVRPDTLHTFRCNSYAATLRGAWIAGRLLRKP
jgi:hypothetical protein